MKWLQTRKKKSQEKNIEELRGSVYGAMFWKFKKIFKKMSLQELRPATETHLELIRTLRRTFFLLLVVNNFRKKAPSQMFDWVLNMDLCNINKHRHRHAVSNFLEIPENPWIATSQSYKKLDGVESMKLKKLFDIWFSFPDMKITWMHCLGQFKKFMILRKHLLEKSTEASVYIVQNINRIASFTW